MSRMATPPRTLHIDTEGGWGGSSRSLFELISRLAPRAIDPVVVVRRDGPVRERYARLGIPTIFLPDLPSYLPRPGIAWADLVKAMPKLLGVNRAAARLADIAAKQKVQVMHFNHEGLMPLAATLKRRTGLPLIAHLRASSLGHDLPARWLARALARSADHLIFISPMEEKWFRSHRPGNTPPGSIVWNISPEPLPRAAEPEVPEIVYLGNIDPKKGTDRLIDIAEALERQGAPPSRIVAYGMARQYPDYEAHLRNRVAGANLAHRFAFGGYATDPREVLARAFALVRPSRLDDPWGRDVIEAVTAGVPVLATGTFDGVVRAGETGWLFSPFDADAIANRLAMLLRDRPHHARLCETAARFGRERFLGDEQVACVASIFSNAARSNRP